MKKIFTLLAFFTVFTVNAASFNCKSLWGKGYPDSRFPGGLECSFSKKIIVDGFTADVYHYTKGFPESPEDTGFTFRTEEVFKDVVKTIREIKSQTYNRFYTLPISFIFTNQKPSSPTSVAKVFQTHSADDETCPLIVYIEPFKKQTPERQRQMLAHELFHCVQDASWRDKITGTDRRVHEWWIEGSAVWFSNLVYPNVNQEYDYNNDYEGHAPLVLQKEGNAYSTYLFFQSIAQGWLDIRGTIGFIKDLPESGGTAEQIQAVTDFTSIELHFNSFAEKLTSSKIADYNGVNIPTSMASDTDTVKINEGDNMIEWHIAPLTIKIKQLDLPAKSIVSFDNQSDNQAGFNQLSMRRTGRDDMWLDMIGGYPTTIDLSCKTFSQSIDVISAYAGTDPLAEKYRLKVSAKPATCRCVEKLPFDKCLAGNYELDKNSMDKMFRSILKFKNYEVENTNGGYSLNISNTQKFTFTYNQFSASVIVKDEEYGDRRVFVKLDGSTDAIGKLTAPNELCFSDIGTDINTTIRIDFPSGSVESTQAFPQFEELSRVPLKYTCNSKEMNYTVKLPTPDGEEEDFQIRFVRK